MVDVPQALSIALQHHQAGQLQTAEQIYRQILTVDPDHAEATHFLGMLAHQVGRHDVAVEYMQRSIELGGDEASFHNNLGEVYRTLRNIPAAVACYRVALARNPSFFEALYNLGNVLKFQGEWAEVISCYQRALALRPDNAEAHNNLGNAYLHQQKYDEAVACYRRALQLKPSYAEAYNNLGIVLPLLGKTDEAVACFRQAINLKPDFTEAANKLVFNINFCRGFSAEKIYEELSRWNDQWAAPLVNLIQPLTIDRSADRRLRIGYVSPYFREHCQAFFTYPLLANHDRSRYEIYAYSNVQVPDWRTAEIKTMVDHWRDIADLDDDQAAELIRQDQIDILVDLTMHMGHHRLLVFARHPAPVQVCWLAYPGTTGLKTMDYRLTDPYLDPPGTDEQFYSEKSIRLPETFWCYDPLTTTPHVNDLPLSVKGYVTFGCLNNFCKVSDDVLTLWAKVLLAVPNSRMIIMSPEGVNRQQALDLFNRLGVTSDRIAFVPLQPRPRYLEEYHHIDIGLDTFPYNGHTTSLDSYWMGVPVVTLVGNRIAGRAGVSQLTNLGLSDLIANSPVEYVKIATDLAHDLVRLLDLRSMLRERLQASSLMNAPRFAKNIEAAYRTMWREWIASS